MLGIGPGTRRAHTSTYILMISSVVSVGLRKLVSGYDIPILPSSPGQGEMKQVDLLEGVATRSDIVPVVQTPAEAHVTKNVRNGSRWYTSLDQ
jgi:hypothetical protein